MLLAYRSYTKCKKDAIVIYKNRLFFMQSTIKLLDSTCDVILEKFGCKHESKRFYSFNGEKRLWETLDDEILTLLNIHYFPETCFVLGQIKHPETMICLHDIDDGNIILHSAPSDTLINIIENYDNIYLTV